MNVHIRQAAISDLPDINRLVESAVMNWEMPERVKRLSLPSYQYDDQDFLHMKIYIAENDEQKLVGVYALSDAAIDNKSQSACLLHGIYVLPDFQRQGIGEALFADAEDHLKKTGGNRLLVKAQAGAIGFFQAQGMTERPVKNNVRDYPYLFQKEVTDYGK